MLCERRLLLLGVLTCAILCTGVATQPALAAAGDDLVITGRYQLSINATAITGSREQFELDTGIEPGESFAQHLSLLGFGQLSNGWSFEGRYDDTLPVPERLDMRLRKAGNELYVGSSRFAAGGPGLLDWGRFLTGLQGSIVAGTAKNWQLRLAVGEPLGVPAHDSLPGRGLVGPYLLNGLHIPVVEGSESVTVDGIPMRRDIDYEIDYELGAITFREPVLENAKIEVDYEYQAPQTRRASLATLRWRGESGTVHVLAADERALAEIENPLVFDPRDGSTPDELPQRQRMGGVAATWSPGGGLTFTGSVLTTTRDDAAHTQPVTAWQLGSEWEQGAVKAGFDYRVYPQGFLAIGRSPDEAGRRVLTGGYQAELGPAWRSWMNLVWERDEAEGTTTHQADHQLVYESKTAQVGWGLTLAAADGASARQAVSSGVTASTRGRDWQLEAERRGMVAHWGEREPGDILSLTTLTARLAGQRPYTATVRWQEDWRAATGDLADRTTVLRATLGSNAATAADALLPVAEAGFWRLQGLLSTTGKAIGPQPGASPGQVTQVRYGRAEAGMPLGLAGLSGDVVAEVKERTDSAGPRTFDSNIKGALHLQRKWQWDAYVAEQTAQTGDDVRQQLGQGVELTIPVTAGWAGRAGLHSFAETGELERATGLQHVYGISWTNRTWRLAADVTGGLLEQPEPPDSEDDDDDEDEPESPPLSELPVGRRLALSVERMGDAGQARARLARDWETAAVAWRLELAGTVRLAQMELDGQYDYLWRVGAGDELRRQSGRLTMQWWVGQQTLFGLTARTDVRVSSDGQDDYRATGMFGEWTARF